MFQDRSLSDLKVHSKLENVVETLDQCNSLIDIRFPVLKDNGHFEIVRGFRAHYGEIVRHTPCLGGLRINRSITRDHMKALSVLSAMKNSCHGIGLSGAHGGIKINPEEYTEDKLKEIIELYTTELHKKGYCNQGDIIHPDINTSKKEMKWISKAVAKCSGQNNNVVSIQECEKAAALGALKSLEIIMDNNELMTTIGFAECGLKNRRFILLGLGKVGRPLGLMMVKKGAICVGVKEKEAYLYDAKGIDLEKLCRHRDETGTIETFGLAKTEYPDSIFTEDCDILVLAACHKSLVCYVARDVKAKVILEASDGPVTPSAHKILTTKTKIVVPDIYACAGTNVISFFEYFRNLQQIGNSEESLLNYSNKMYADIFKNVIQNKCKSEIGVNQTQNIKNDFKPLDRDFIQNAIDCVFSQVGQEILDNLTAKRLGVDMRTAAYVVAIKNMFKTIYEEKKLV